MRLPGGVPDLHKQLQQVIEQKLPSAPGKRLTAQIEYHFRRDPRLMGQGIQNVAELMKQGAYDYLQKPFEVDELLVAVRRRRLGDQRRPGLFCDVSSGHFVAE